MIQAALANFVGYNNNFGGGGGGNWQNNRNGGFNNNFGGHGSHPYGGGGGGKGKGKNKGAKGLCHLCGKQGHKRAQCPQNKKGGKGGK